MIRYSFQSIILPLIYTQIHIRLQGYTSLGKQPDTFPNPSLIKQDGSGEYNPAYMLTDWSMERAGRGSSSIKQKGDEIMSSGENDEVPGCDLKKPPA